MYDKTIEEEKKRIEFEQQKKLERSKMTDSLRYDILRRDEYRCCICGVCASEGAKLHVDHIMPIAKGGKTVPDNLQTLCDRCNLGKSDKFDDKVLEITANLKKHLSDEEVRGENIQRALKRHEEVYVEKGYKEIKKHKEICNKGGTKESKRKFKRISLQH
jgi:5-methylcytosine-specific restriction endonuclease McrA